MNNLIIKNVSYSYGFNDVLNSVNFVAKENQITTILGESGSGKSTLLRIIAGLLKPSAGEIIFGDKILYDRDRYVPCEKRKFGYVPQDGALFFNLNIFNNVVFGLNKKERKSQEVIELLDKVGLLAFRKRMPHELSGGQRQRVTLARALAVKPDLILLDEPFSSLDANLRNEVRFEVKNILSQFNTSAILVTHDQDEALSISDSIAILKHGKFIAQADPKQIYSSPMSLDVANYFGQMNIIDGIITQDGVKTVLGLLQFNSLNLPDDLPETPNSKIKVLIRPEQIMIKETKSGSNQFKVNDIEYFGHDSLIELVFTDTSEEPLHLIMRNSTTNQIDPNEIVEIYITGKVSIFNGQ